MNPNPVWKFFARLALSTLLFAVVAFLVQCGIVLLMLITGVAMGIPAHYVFWITIIYEPKDYMEVGQLHFMLWALAFNTLILSIPYVLVYSLIKLIKKQ
jgi:hypothetical protein